jgi:hypothetical protein
MKFILNLFGLALAATLGYVAEPHLRDFLTGLPSTGSEGIELQEPADSTPTTPPAPELQIDLTSLRPDQLPERVMLYAETKASDASGVVIKIEPGSRVKLLRVEGGNAIISPGAGAFEGIVPVNGTDLLQQLAANPPQEKTEPAPEPVPAEETTPMPEPAPAEESPPEPAAESAPVADVIGTMQASIRAGQIKEFSFAQVQEWTQEPDEEIDGEKYQIGIATYKAETLFGVRAIQAKALIKDGKVQRWIYRKSGMDMK